MVRKQVLVDLSKLLYSLEQLLAQGSSVKMRENKSTSSIHLITIFIYQVISSIMYGLVEPQLANYVHSIGESANEMLVLIEFLLHKIIIIFAGTSAYFTHQVL
jgi:hypothetical protein